MVRPDYIFICICWDNKWFKFINSHVSSRKTKLLVLSFKYHFHHDSWLLVDRHSVQIKQVHSLISRVFKIDALDCAESCLCKCRMLLPWEVLVCEVVDTLKEETTILTDESFVALEEVVYFVANLRNVQTTLLRFSKIEREFNAFESLV